MEFVRLNGRGTIRQLSDEIGVSHTSVGRLCMELAASGDVYNSGYRYSRLSRRAGLAKRPQKTLKGKAEETICG